MMSVIEAAWVIARRDFVATVWSRSFIFFLLAPLLIVGFSALVGGAMGQADNEASQPKVALITDSETSRAFKAARDRLVRGTSERSFPVLQVVEPAENVSVQARQLLADEEAGLSAVLSGTIMQPVLIAPSRVDEFVARRTGLVVEEAQRERILRAAAPDFQPAQMRRELVAEAAGNLREIRIAVARGGQGLIFFFTLLLAGLLLSNLVEEKSSKVIEVLAAAVPLDAVFLGKLLAMLGISLVGILAWGVLFGVGAILSLQLLPVGLALPPIAPAIGWPVYLILLPVYYATNYMLLGSLFLGIGGQASNIREIQTLSMPVTFLQLGVFFLAMQAVGDDGGMLRWIAFVFPFSSPLAMIAYAAEYPTLWPHLLALLWQALWIFLIIRIAASLFRKTVLKSGGRTRLLPSFRLRQG